MSDKQPEREDSPSPGRGFIKVVPLGRVGPDVLTVVADSVQGVLRLPVDLVEQIPLPEEAYLNSRQQYNAMTIIKHLSANYAHTCLKVLGVTAKDITNPILTYVFGEAYMNGAAAVLSYARLREGPDARPVARELLLDRIVKVAIHEIGHTFDLPHCHNGRCVMRASHSVMELEEKLNYLCDYCELFLSEAVTQAIRRPQEESAAAAEK